MLENQLDSLISIFELINDDPSVFEGLYPMWADVDGDGAQDLITTRSNARSGAQIVVVRIGGNEFSSPAMDAPAFSFQGHPEASPGPHDLLPLFERFIQDMEAQKRSTIRSVISS